MVLAVINDWWGSLGGAEQLFWGIAIIFSVLFIIQFVLSLIGFDLDHDVDVDHGGDFSLDTDFTLLSIRTIIAFFTFFGWAGVIVLNSGGSVLQAAIFGGLSGLAAMALVAYLLYLFSKISESGNYDIENALYNTGEVYLTIPEKQVGKGKIHVKIEGTLREMDAVTHGKALPTGTQIRVVDILSENTLLVEPTKLLEPLDND
jgi:hypothetical protein